MGEDLIKVSWRKLASAVLMTVFALTLTACGGGGGSPGGTTGGGTTTDTSNGSVEIALTYTDGGAAYDDVAISGTDSLRATATVRDENGSAVPGVIVQFTLTSGETYGTISPSSGSTLTNASGQASVSFSSAGVGSSAVTVQAAATPVAEEITASDNFLVGANASATPVAMNFDSAVPDDLSIVIAGSGGNGRSEVALLTFKVVDDSNQGIPDVDVDFSLNTNAPVTLVSTSGTTDADGYVTVAVNSGDSPTTVRVIATASDTPAVSTMSDTISVVTGQPVQASFTLVPEIPNFECWNDNIGAVNPVTALLADENGDAVADGTQVVFTTDGGAMVGTPDAMCTTVNGACSINWRCQKVFTPVATIFARATNATDTLTTSAQIHMAGSYADIYYPSAAASPVGSIDISSEFVGSCSAYTMQIRVADVNGGPMPYTTTVSIQSENEATVELAPGEGEIPKITPISTGTNHSILIEPSDKCDTAGLDTINGRFYIVVESPLGNTVVVPVTFDFAGTAD